MPTITGTLLGRDGTLRLRLADREVTLADEAARALAQPDLLETRVGGPETCHHRVMLRAEISSGAVVRIEAALIEHEAWVAVAGAWWSPLWRASDLAPRIDTVEVQAQGSEVRLEGVGADLDPLAGALPGYLPYFFPTHPSPLTARIGHDHERRGHPLWILLRLAPAAGLLLHDPERFTEAAMPWLASKLGVV